MSDEKKSPCSGCNPKDGCPSQNNDPLNTNQSPCSGDCDCDGTGNGKNQGRPGCSGNRDGSCGQGPAHQNPGDCHKDPPKPKSKG